MSFDEKDKREVDNEIRNVYISKIIAELNFHEQLISYFGSNQMVQKATVERKRDYLRKLAMDEIVNLTLVGQSND